MACSAGTYKLDGTDLATFGFAPFAPMALSGHLDLPVRTGKTFHSWEDMNFVEAYVSPDDMMFSGRDLILKGYISGDTNALNSFIDGFTDSVPLEWAYGTYDVVVMSISVNKICGHDLSEISIKFRESVADLSGTLPGSQLGGDGIDGYSFAQLGVSKWGASGMYDRGDAKVLPVSVYGYEKTRTRARNSNTISLYLVYQGADYQDVQDNVQSTIHLLSSPGIRLLTAYGETYSVFAKDGLLFGEVKKYGNNFTAIGTVNLTIGTT